MVVRDATLLHAPREQRLYQKCAPWRRVPAKTRAQNRGTGFLRHRTLWDAHRWRSGAERSSVRISLTPRTRHRGTGASSRRLGCIGVHQLGVWGGRHRTPDLTQQTRLLTAGGSV